MPATASTQKEFGEKYPSIQFIPFWVSAFCGMSTLFMPFMIWLKDSYFYHIDFGEYNPARTEEFILDLLLFIMISLFSVSGMWMLNMHVILSFLSRDDVEFEPAQPTVKEIIHRNQHILTILVTTYGGGRRRNLKSVLCPAAP